MTANVVHLQPAYIVSQRHYKETSLILDVLTRDYGRVSLLAKGVRKTKSKTAGLLQPFIPLTLSYLGKTELKTLTNVELRQAFKPLPGMALYCGFYINELVGYFLHPYDPHPEVFSHYHDCLALLMTGLNIEQALRTFELDLMDAVGLGLQLEYDFNTEQPLQPLSHYHFTAEQGPIAAVEGRFTGKTLLAIKRRDFSHPQVLIDAKILMRTVIDVYLQGKPLKSRAVIHNINNYL